MSQQQKPLPDTAEALKPKGPRGNDELSAAASKSKDLLDRLDKATKKKKKSGHYEICCGVRVWIPGDDE